MIVVENFEICVMSHMTPVQIFFLPYAPTIPFPFTHISGAPSPSHPRPLALDPAAPADATFLALICR